MSNLAISTFVKLNLKNSMNNTNVKKNKTKIRKDNPFFNKTLDGSFFHNEINEVNKKLIKPDISKKDLDLSNISVNISNFEKNTLNRSENDLTIKSDFSLRNSSLPKLTRPKEGNKEIINVKRINISTKKPVSNPIKNWIYKSDEKIEKFDDSKQNLIVSPNKTCSKSMVSLNNSNSTKLETSINKMLDRFDILKAKSSDKFNKLKEKYESEMAKKFTNVPEINKNPKYYDKEKEDFLKRVNIYKSISQGKKLDLLEMEKARMEKMMNCNPNLRKKMKKDEINKMIEEKVINYLKKENVKKENIEKIRKEKELEDLKYCTFRPQILKCSYKLAERRKNTLKEQNLNLTMKDEDLKSTIKEPKERIQKNKTSKDLFSTNFTNNKDLNKSLNYRSKSISDIIKKNNNVSKINNNEKLENSSITKKKNTNNNNIKNNLNKTVQNVKQIDEQDLHIPNISLKESLIIKQLLKEKYNIES